MNKTIILILGISLQVLFGIHNSLGQSADTDVPPELLNKIADDACKCIKEIEPGLDKSNLDTELQTCIQNSVVQHVAELMASGVMDRETGEKMGVELGKILLSKCPAFVQMTMEASTNDKKGMLPSNNTTTGTLKEVEVEGLAYFVLKTPSGEQRFLWSGQFPDSKRFISDLDNYLGKTLEISWKKTDVYNPKTANYQEALEVTAIEVQ